MLVDLFWNTVLDITEPLWYGGQSSKTHTVVYVTPRMSLKEADEIDRKCDELIKKFEERKREAAKQGALSHIRKQPYYN